MMQQKCLIAAGGTGGHIFPGLAIARSLIVQGILVEWVGTIDGLEFKLVPANNIKIHYIDIKGFRGKNIFIKISTIIKIFTSLVQSIKLLYKLKPNVVLGFGGFVSGPIGLAAWLLRIPLVIHEQNAIAGTSNKILGVVADRILGSFEHSFPNCRIYNRKFLLTGNPIREEFTKTRILDPGKPILTKEFKILVLGGSRGSRFLNELIPLALGKLPGVTIVHQTGEQDYNYTMELYASYNILSLHQITPFIDDSVEAYANADLVICRSGGSTIFEIMATGVASIMVPLPWAIDDHQTKNAQYLAASQAGILIPQANLNAAKLQEVVLDLKNNYNKLLSIKHAVNELYERYRLNNSVNRVVTTLLELNYLTELIK